MLNPGGQPGGTIGLSGTTGSASASMSSTGTISVAEAVAHLERTTGSDALCKYRGAPPPPPPPVSLPYKIRGTDDALNFNKGK